MYLKKFICYDIKDIQFLDGEVKAVMWVDIDEFVNMFDNGQIVYNVNFDASDYKKCILLCNK